MQASIPTLPPNASPHRVNHPEGNGMIERFHRSLKEEEIWLNEYRSLEESRYFVVRSHST